MRASEKHSTLLWALWMTAPAACLVIASLYPPPGMAGVGSPFWTCTAALAGIGWITYDFRRLRQRRHLEAFWRAYRARFPDVPEDIPDERVLARYLEECPRTPTPEDPMQRGQTP